MQCSSVSGACLVQGEEGVNVGVRVSVGGDDVGVVMQFNARSGR
jgi:hypothetical protein